MKINYLLILMLLSITCLANNRSLIQIISDRGLTEEQKLPQMCEAIDKGADVNQHSRDIPNFTPLMRAADLGYYDIVELLLAHQAHINDLDNLLNSALFYAARKGHRNIVLLLLKNGADPRIVDKDKHGNTIILDILRAAGQNLSDAKAAGKNPEEKAKKGDQFKTNITEIIELMLNKGVSVNAHGPHVELSKTAIMFAAQFRIWNLVKVLRDRGADLSLTDAEGNSLLFYLPISKEEKEVYKHMSPCDKQMIKTLVLETIDRLISKANGNINVRGSKRELLKTPIMWAAQFRDWDLVSLLKARGADICLKDAEGKNLSAYLIHQKDEPEIWQSQLTQATRDLIKNLDDEIASKCEGWKIIPFIGQ